MNLKEFIFENNESKHNLVINIPKGISSKIELLLLLGDKLHFPDYYGVNWDALDECIRDLSWLTEKSILIRHADIPLMNDRKLAKTYISALQWAFDKWKDSSEHRMQAFFPLFFKDEIIRILHELELEETGSEVYRHFNFVTP